MNFCIKFNPLKGEAHLNNSKNVDSYVKKNMPLLYYKNISVNITSKNSRLF